MEYKYFKNVYNKMRFILEPIEIRKERNRKKTKIFKSLFKLYADSEMSESFCKLCKAP